MSYTDVKRSLASWTRRPGPRRFRPLIALRHVGGPGYRRRPMTSPDLSSLGQRLRRPRHAAARREVRVRGPHMDRAVGELLLDDLARTRLSGAPMAGGQGYIKGRDSPNGARARRTFNVTAAGERALREWLRRPSRPHLRAARPGLLKLFFADVLEPDEAIAHVRAMRLRASDSLARFERDIEPASAAEESSGVYFPHITATFAIEFYSLGHRLVRATRDRAGVRGPRRQEPSSGDIIIRVSGFESLLRHPHDGPRSASSRTGRDATTSMLSFRQVGRRPPPRSRCPASGKRPRTPTGEAVRTPPRSPLSRVPARSPGASSRSAAPRPTRAWPSRSRRHAPRSSSRSPRSPAASRTSQRGTRLGGLASSSLGKVRAATRAQRRGVVVDDVVDTTARPRSTASAGRRGGVFDMNVREDATTIADDRESALADRIGAICASGERD